MTTISDGSTGDPGAGSSAVIHDAIAFLKGIPPFSSLDEEALINVTSGIMMDFFPKGHVISYQDEPSPEYFGIVRSGRVKVFVKTHEGEEVVLDYRSGGDFFGFLSMIGGDVSRNTVVAVEDATCYLIQKNRILELLKARPAFAEYFLRSFLKKLADLTYREIHDRTLLYGGGDKLLFTTTIGDLSAMKVITAPQDISILDAARLMSKHNISSLVLLDNDRFPAGIITDKDLRDKVVARGRDLSDSVGHIMNVTLIKSESRDYCFEALLKMIRYNIHHLLVLDKGELKGMITNHDLMIFQGTSPISIAREIENQTSIDSLVPVARKINKIIEILVREGARSGNITRIITEVNDRLLRRMLELIEKKMGPPPASYCWIVFGSEGRKEQTFRTDQDNAIIYQDPPDASGSEVKDYFSSFARQMSDSLAKCGFPKCSADYMASNPSWCQPLSVWKKYFSEWITTPTPDAILNSLIFFDFRPIHGNSMIAEALRAFLGQRLKSQNIFFAHMAGVILKNRPPVNFLKRFRLEKDGEHRDTFNIKISALSPIVDAARFSALELGVYATSTLDRLRELKERGGAISGLSHDLGQAFEFLMSVRLRHQFEQLQNGKPPDNFINPDGLGLIERKTLLESFRIVSLAQDAIRNQYGSVLTM